MLLLVVAQIEERGELLKWFLGKQKLGERLVQHAAAYF